MHACQCLLSIVGRQTVGRACKGRRYDAQSLLLPVASGPAIRYRIETKTRRRLHDVPVVASTSRMPVRALHLPLLHRPTRALHLRPASHRRCCAAACDICNEEEARERERQRRSAHGGSTRDRRQGDEKLPPQQRRCCPVIIAVTKSGEWLAKQHARRLAHLLQQRSAVSQSSVNDGCKNLEARCRRGCTGEFHACNIS